MFKRIIFLISLAVFITSCADDLASVKRGLTGEKKTSSDEFFVKKKDPLILPPDYKNLPLPSDGIDKKDAKEFSKTFKEQVKKNSSNENSSQSTGSVESSILKKIKKK